MLSHPLTQYMFCSPGEGAVALVLCRADQARRYNERPVYLEGGGAAVRGASARSRCSARGWRSNVPTAPPSTRPRPPSSMAGVGPDDIDVAQIQDTESGAEIMHMAETGLCKHGEQEALIQTGATEIGGSMPINTDGGCLANGEPIGASGLRQVYESVLQLRGDAGPRQVPDDPQTAFTHVYGAPGISACTVLTR